MVQGCLALYHTLFHLFMFSILFCKGPWLNAGLMPFSDGHATIGLPRLIPPANSHNGTTIARHRYINQPHNTVPALRTHLQPARGCTYSTHTMPRQQPLSLKVFIDLIRLDYDLYFTSRYTHFHLLCDLSGVTGATVGCYGITAGIGHAGAQPKPFWTTLCF